MIKVDLVRLNTAILAKKKGFNDKCNYFYNIHDKIQDISIGFSSERWWNIHTVRKILYPNNYTLLQYYTRYTIKAVAPSQDMLNEWLKKKGYEVFVIPKEDTYTFIIRNLENKSSYMSNKTWKLRKSAYENGLIKTLMLL